MAPKNGSEHFDDFEGSFRRLQEVVQRLSEGSLTLQEAMAAFEEGMDLADRCTRMLDAAELRVKQVSEKTMRAASAQVAEELVAAPRATIEEPGLVTFDVEEVESLTLFTGGDAKPKGQTTTGNSAEDLSGRSSATRATNPSTQKAQKSRQVDLDPLFDEDD